MENVIHYKNPYTLKNVVTVEAEFQRKKFFGESIRLHCTFEDGVMTTLKMGRAEILTAIWVNPPKQHFSPKTIMCLHSAEVRHNDNSHTIKIICRLRNCKVKTITLEEDFFDFLVECCTAIFPWFWNQSPSREGLFLENYLFNKLKIYNIIFLCYFIIIFGKGKLCPKHK